MKEQEYVYLPIHYGKRLKILYNPIEVKKRENKKHRDITEHNKYTNQIVSNQEFMRQIDLEDRYDKLIMQVVILTEVKEQMDQRQYCLDLHI